MHEPMTDLTVTRVSNDEDFNVKMADGRLTWYKHRSQWLQPVWKRVCRCMVFVVDFFGNRYHAAP
jgi:hypothetical protein